MKPSRVRINTTEELFQELIDDYSKTQAHLVFLARDKKITKEDFLKEVKKHIDSYYIVDEEIKTAGIKEFENYIFGYSRITHLIDDPQITDIRIISHDNIRVKRLGVRMDAETKFPSKEEYCSFIDYVATRNQVNVSNLNAIQRFTDNETSDSHILRFTVSMPLVNTYDEPYLCIRKIPKDFPLLQDLVEQQMLSQELADILKYRFANGSTLICGGNSAGKTTILNALKESLPDTYSVLIAQQADELTTKRHPDTMFLHSLPGSSESQAKYDLKNISIAGLTMDVDFFIVGEIKGDEAAYLLNAAYTGQICAGTIHAPSAPKAVDKLIDYSMVGGNYTKQELTKMMDCFKTVIFMKKYKVNQVYSIDGYNKETGELDYSPIFENRRLVNPNPTM